MLFVCVFPQTLKGPHASQKLINGFVPIPGMEVRVVAVFSAVFAAGATDMVHSETKEGSILKRLVL